MFVCRFPLGDGGVQTSIHIKSLIKVIYDKRHEETNDVKKYNLVSIPLKHTTLNIFVFILYCFSLATCYIFRVVV